MLARKCVALMQFHSHRYTHAHQLVMQGRQSARRLAAEREKLDKECTFKPATNPTFHGVKAMCVPSASTLVCNVPCTSPHPRAWPMWQVLASVPWLAKQGQAASGRAVRQCTLSTHSTVVATERRLSHAIAALPPPCRRQEQRRKEQAECTFKPTLVGQQVLDFNGTRPHCSATSVCA